MRNAQLPLFLLFSVPLAKREVCLTILNTLTETLKIMPTRVFGNTTPDYQIEIPCLMEGAKKAALYKDLYLIISLMMMTMITKMTMMMTMRHEEHKF